MEIKYRNNNKEIFAPLKNAWLVATPEEIIRQETIRKLVDEYGYDLKQMEQELAVTNAKNGNGRARADIVIWKSESDRKNKNSAFIVIECKAEYVKLTKDDYAQGINYASWTNAQFCVITNKNDWKYFKILSDKIFPENVVEINGIPLANEINSPKRIKEILDTERFFSKDDFQRLLFDCHNVIRNNDKMSPEMAFDEISKILFMKIMFERDEKIIFSKKKFLSIKTEQERYSVDKPFYQKLFDKTKQDFAKDEIFEENATLRIREESFLEIVEKLQNYNLSKTDDDVKGIAFEEFLGTTFRGELGQYFTPRTVVEFMVELLDPQEGELVCDPCCGSGGFLIHTFDYIKDKVVKDIQAAKDKIRKELYLDNYQSLSLEQKLEVNGQLNDCIKKLEVDLDKDADIINDKGKKEPSRLKRLSSLSIFGTDAEPRSARTAKMNMIMHGDGHGGVHFHDGLWNVNGIFENRFDVIITNPPFGSRVSKNFSVKLSELLPSEEKKKYYTEKYGETYTEAYRNTEKRFYAIQSDRKNSNKKLDEMGEGVPLTSFFETGEMSSLTEVLFMERCLNLLKPGGRMGVVLPEGFLNGSDLQRVREYFEGKAKLLLIVSLPQEIFVSAGASVKSSLVFLKKFTTYERDNYDRIKREAIKEINEKYQPQITEKEKEHKRYWHEIQRLQAYIKDVKSIKTSKSEKDLQIMATNSQVTETTRLHKEAKAAFDKWETDLDKRIEAEIKAEIKERFDYGLVMAQIEKAGINSTGQKTDNQLVELKKEFEHYRKQEGLWKSETFKFEYGVLRNGEYQRVLIKTVA
jgi:type I restriction enzyme M protein